MGMQSRSSVAGAKETNGRLIYYPEATFPRRRQGAYIFCEPPPKEKVPLPHKVGASPARDKVANSVRQSSTSHRAEKQAR
ncbi:hypothetical protein MRX96_035731 [Rhipicephalus microplus]